MQLTRCPDHTGAPLVEDTRQASETVWSLLVLIKRTMNSSVFAGMLVSARRDREELNCCPAAAYASYLACAAVRDATHGG